MKKLKKSTTWIILVICVTVFIGCGVLCFLNLDVFKNKPFQQTTSIDGSAMAKYEKDGNVYIIDNGSFRLICMEPDGNIIYTIIIDKMKEYTRIIDSVIDEAGNLYVYAIEAEYNALLTKRDIIRKYDRHGHFVKDILSVEYFNAYSNPRLFYQFGSFQCDNGILTFSRTQQDRVTLYQYDTFREEMQQSVISDGVHDFSVAQLVLKDFQNYIYVQRDGDIYQVKNGGEPELRVSFNWILGEGGILPWHIFYEKNDDFVFFDMGSNALFRVSGNELHRVVPEEFFKPFVEQGEVPTLKGFGFHGNTFAGVFGETVWLYDGSNFTVYDDELLLPLGERLRISIVQVSLALGIIAFVAGIFILFVGILDRYVSLFIKMTVVIIPLLVIAFIIVFTVTFNIMSEQLNEKLYDEMITMAILSAKMIDGDDLDNIKSIKDFHTPEYKNLSRQVKEFVGFNADPWNQAYYAAIYKGEKMKYVIVISCEEYNLFRPDEEVDEEDHETLISGQPIVQTSDLFNGTWTFANTYIYNSSGDVAGMFEVGLDMTSYQIGNAKLKSQVALITAFVCVIILFALGIMVSIVVKQLSSVATVLHAISEGNRNERVRYKALDELGKVGQGLNRMAEELQLQFDRITTLNESTIRFVPVQFMEQLGVSDITKMKLGDNVQRNISVLFFDIRYFSINSEMMTARENFKLINNILGIAGPIIRKHNGFVDKYIGDAAMALFVNGIDAVRAGIELYKTLVIDEKTRVEIGVDVINIGVGVHTGNVMMGIVGENERLSSTVISENVNLASRVEGLSKQTGSGLLITRDTMNQLAGNESEFTYRFLGMIQAAGVNEVVGLFDMFDALPPSERKIRLATKAVFESGVRKYHMKDYATAVERFEKVVAADPKDICAAHHLEESRKRIKDPSLPSVFTFDKK